MSSGGVWFTCGWQVGAGALGVRVDGTVRGGEGPNWASLFCGKWEGGQQLSLGLSWGAGGEVHSTPGPEAPSAPWAGAAFLALWMPVLGWGRHRAERGQLPGCVGRDRWHHSGVCWVRREARDGDKPRGKGSPWVM